MRGRRFLDVADGLEGREGEEWDRTRIGRLYYGTYLEYRQFCIDEMGLLPRKFAREHQVVNDLVRTLDQDLSDLLRELRYTRNEADYDLDVAPEHIAHRATSADQIAKVIMARLAELRSGTA